MNAEQNLIENLNTNSNNKTTPQSSGMGKFDFQGVALHAHSLKGHTRSGTVLLNDISISIPPGQLAILAGVQGSGTSTLIRALAGMRAISEGEVLVNNTKIGEYIRGNRTKIGFVPLEDATHHELSVFETLQDAAQLRLPAGTSHAEKKIRIDGILDLAGLTDIGSRRIAGLNAGTKKIVTIAIELLTLPGLLFVEDPFVGLDTVEANHVFRFLRNLAIHGLTVILTTHSAEYLNQADLVGILTIEKSLAWFGPPGEALEYFASHGKDTGQQTELSQFSQVFDLVNDPALGTPQDWASKYQAAPARSNYAGDGTKEVKQILGMDDRPLANRQIGLGEGQRKEASKPAGTLSQWVVLTRRNLRLLIRDRTSLFLMLVAPLLIACSDFIFSSRKMYDATLGDPQRISFSLALLIFLSMALAGVSWVREFHKETSVYHRERQATLKIFPFVMSVVWIALAVALYQGLVWTLVHFLAAALPIRPTVVLNYYLFISLVILVGGILGVLASSLMSSEKKSIILLSLLLIPQLLLTGVFLPFPQLNPVVSAIASFLPSHLAFQGLSTADGHGAVLASDYCWRLPADQRQGLSDLQKQSLCSCMGINIFRLCSFPGIKQFYSPVLDQPEPEVPTFDQAFKFPDPPTPAPGDTLQQYEQTVKNSFATALEGNLATSGINQGNLTQYMNEFTTWETGRKTAVSNAESVLGQEFSNYAADYNVNLAYPLLGLIAECILIVLLIVVSVKRKDFLHDEDA